MSAGRQRQDGAVMLILLVAVLLAGSAAYLAKANRSGAVAEGERRLRTAQALSAAKAALVAYAATAAIPGQLPCPEDPVSVGNATEGQALSSCSNSKVLVGRLPWRSLSLGDVRDGNGERLWYALSPGFRSAPINSNSVAGLRVDGVDGAAVAIVMSAGIATVGQIRTATGLGNAPTVTNYLDGINASGTKDFVTFENDVLRPVTREDLFPAVERRVLSEVARALWIHYCGVSNWVAGGGCLTAADGQRFFPPPAAVSDSGCLGTAAIAASSGKCPSATGGAVGRVPANPSPLWTAEDVHSLLRGETGSGNDWFQKNGWRELIFYSVALPCGSGTKHCNGSGAYLGIQPDRGAPVGDLKVVLAAAGMSLTGQVRSTTAAKKAIGNYLEGDNGAPLAGLFISGVGTRMQFNDLLRGLP